MAKPRVLLYDIETAPNLVYTWGVYEQNVIEVVRHWYVLCFAYKWLDESKTHVVALPDFEEYLKNPDNDYHVIQELHNLFNEADVLIAHNGNKFDQKKVQARFIVHGFDPPMHYRQIDTLQVARQKFKFDSNKLNDLGTVLQAGKKVPTGGFALWLGCMEGDPKAWDKMKRYNKQDVVLLEQVYLKLRPWISNHPDMAALADNQAGCPKCGGFDWQKRGIKHNKTTSNQQYQCNSCKGYFYSRVAIKKSPPEFTN